MYKIIFFGWLGSFCLYANAQNHSVDSIAAAQRTIMLKKKEHLLIYPLLKGDVATGIQPVSAVTEDIDPKMTYKLLFDCTQGNPMQYKNGTINEGLEEIARIINLHKGAGVKDNKLQIKMVVHSIASLSFLSDEAYNKRFNMNNPNKDLIQQLQKAGVTIIVCGQTMQYRDIENKDLLIGIKKAFSARTALSTYLSKGFVAFTIAEPH